MHFAVEFTRAHTKVPFSAALTFLVLFCAFGGVSDLSSAVPPPPLLPLACCCGRFRPGRSPANVQEMVEVEIRETPKRPPFSAPGLVGPGLGAGGRAVTGNDTALASTVNGLAAAAAAAAAATGGGFPDSASLSPDALFRAYLEREREGGRNVSEKVSVWIEYRTTLPWVGPVKRGVWMIVSSVGRSVGRSTDRLVGVIGRAVGRTVPCEYGCDQIVGGRFLRGRVTASFSLNILVFGGQSKKDHTFSHARELGRLVPVRKLWKSGFLHFRPLL